MKEKIMIMNAERGLFAKLLIIAEKRKTMTMKELLTYSVGPVPWFLALPDGGLVKTLKSKLLDALEADVPPL